MHYPLERRKFSSSLALSLSLSLSQNTLMLMVLAAGSNSLSAIPIHGYPRAGRSRLCKRGLLHFQVAASSEMATSGGERATTVFEEGRLDHPKWSGETPLSRLVSTLISIKPIFSILKLGARQVLISTAEKKNIPWREMTREVLESDVYSELETIRDASIVYPDYYLSPFHAYDEGNLSWLAAAEAEAATMSMVRRALPDVASADEANEIMYGGWLGTIEKHHLQYSANTIQDILDIGCSVGVSTRYLADKYPSAKVTGLDLSPYFLAVAQFKEKKRTAPRTNWITWVHANGEETGLPSRSFDLVSIAYVLHECPETAIVGLLKEAFRLLRPGGTLVVTDQSPKSKALQDLPPAIFTLLKSTEPFLDEYHLTDLEGRMGEVGFLNVTSVMTDPRHRTVTGTVPSV